MVIHLGNPDKEKGESPHMRKFVVRGHFDKHDTIDELETFKTQGQLLEKHPDLKISYEKHCDGWRGFITYQGEDEGVEKDPQILKALDLRNEVAKFVYGNPDDFDADIPPKNRRKIQ